MAKERAGRRIACLDGARGVACLAVVVYHCVMTGSGSPVDAGVANAAPWSLPWLIGRSPLHLIWDGTFAVYVFFALSGYVLTLQMREAAAWDWTRYYPRRLLRLYLPVVGSILFAGACAALVPRVSKPSESGWMLEHVGTSLSNGFVGVLLVHNVRLNSVLWSLHWEVIFSLLLPLAVLVVGRIGPRLALVLGVASLAATALGVHDANGRLEYLPMFLLGALLAGQPELVQRLASRWRRRDTIALTLVVALSQVARWTLAPVISGTSAAFALTTALQAAVTLPLLVLVLCSPVIRRAAERRRVQWLGKRSFSIYLVHEPIVVSAALLLGPHPLEVLAVSMPLALGIAALFWRLVERPSTAFSARAGDSVGQALARLLGRSQPAAESTGPAGLR